jgi:methylated-DNA-[protein]-cysteine S-methyltransferase
MRLPATNVYYDIIEKSPVGRVVVAATSEGLCWVGIGEHANTRLLRSAFPDDRIEKRPAELAPVRFQLQEYFAGTRTVFTLKVDLRAVRSDFNETILEACRQIPFGHTLTYGELAERAGSPGAARAVGTAMSQNPVPIVVPCHRVVASGGLGGFTGGIESKRALLAHEGALLL